VAADADAVPVCRLVGMGAGHVLTKRANRRAPRSTVAGTCTGDLSCLERILTASSTAGGQRPTHDRGDLRHDQRPRPKT
jgi:hypothetical protein